MAAESVVRHKPTFHRIQKTNFVTRLCPESKLLVKPGHQDKRYTATPSGTSDRKHLIGLIQNTTGCSAQRARETLNSLLGTIGASLKKNQKVTPPPSAPAGPAVASRRRQ